MRRDPFLWRLAAIAALSVAVSLVIDYLYRAKVASSLHAEQLAPFFARYQLLLNIGSLLLQLTVTSSVVQRVGVLGLALTAPALLTMGGALSALSSASFAVVVTLKATDSALAQFARARRLRAACGRRSKIRRAAAGSWTCWSPAARRPWRAWSCSAPP